MMAAAEVQAPSSQRGTKVAPRPEIVGWYPPEGKYCGRVLAINLTENLMAVDVIFCEGGDYGGNTRFVVDRATPFFLALFSDASAYTGLVQNRQGRIWEFDYMKINLEMTAEGPAPWFLRPQVSSLKIEPWPVWFDNRPSAKRKKGSQ